MASINKLLDSDETPIHIDYINVNLSKHNKSLNILHTNIRSISKHLNELPRASLYVIKGKISYYNYIGRMER